MSIASSSVRFLLLDSYNSKILSNFQYLISEEVVFNLSGKSSALRPSAGLQW